MPYRNKCEALNIQLDSWQSLYHHWDDVFDNDLTNHLND